MALYSVKDLSFSYTNGKKPALSDVSLSINEGSFVLLCGSTGGGKTTLLRMLKQLIAPSGEKSGEILYDGQDITKIAASRLVGEIGYVFQNVDTQIVCEMVYDELEFGLKNLGLGEPERRRRIAETAGVFGMDTLLSSKVETLSGGKKQQLNLASVLAMDPRVLILDEPTAQLDPVSAAEFMSVIGRLNSRYGITVILSEQNLDEALALADTVCVMNEGRVICCEEKNSAVKKMLTMDFMKNALPASVRLSALFGAQELAVTPLQARALLAQNKNRIRVKEASENSVGAKTAIEIKSAVFRYEKNTPDVLKGTTLSAKYGQLLCIMGANGSGKTTLLEVAAGINKPHFGSIKKAQGSRVSYLCQSEVLCFVRDTLLQDAEFFCEISGIDKSRIAQTMEAYPFFKELKDIKDQNILDLSGGQLQMAALFKVLLSGADILLLDEPSKGLDSDLKQKLGEMLCAIKQAGVCIIAATHDTEFAAAFADRVCLLFDGQVVSAAAPRTFFAENIYYTTPLARITRPVIRGIVTEKDFEIGDVK